MKVTFLGGGGVAIILVYIGRVEYYMVLGILSTEVRLFCDLKLPKVADTEDGLLIFPQFALLYCITT